jgi:hypothetical protein
LFDFDAQDVKKIVIGGPGTEDYYAWNFTKNGQFTVRSAYHLMMHQKKTKAGGVESSNSVEAHRGWLELWNANVPGKVKVHVWRLLKNGLALGAELQRRKIKEGVVCVACGWEETALHHFWHCPHSHFLWKTVGDLTGSMPPLPPANVQNQRDMLNWMLEWFSSAQNEEIEVTLMVIY